MTSVSEFILNFLVNSTWQIAAICMLATAGTYLLRNCSAHYRYIVWITALVFCLIAPAITAMQVVPSLPVTAVSQPMETRPATAVEEVSIDHTRRRNSQVALNATPRHMRFASVAYLLFLGLCAVRFVRLWTAKERLRRSASFDGLTPAIESAAKRCMRLFGIENVHLARSPSARVPYTLGVIRPLIVLPDSFCGDVDEETLLSVIGHEMAHLRRSDLVAKLACELVSLPISFHPFTFFIKRQIERERELACDELVTDQVLKPDTYARSLLRAADLSILPVGRSIMLSVFDGRMLEKRIRQLTRKGMSLRGWPGRMITAGVLASLCVSAIAGSTFGFVFRTPLLDVPAALAAPAAPVSSGPSARVIERTTQDQTPSVANRPTTNAAQELARTACEAGRNRNVDAIPSLVVMLGDDRPTEAIACWNTGRWSPALDTFKHPSPGEEAALALASMGRAALVPLMNQLDSQNAVTRRNAAWAIGELTNMIPGERAQAVPQLIVLLNDPDAWVRMAAARAIGEVRDRRAGETLIATLADSDWRVRRLAAWALNEMKEERAVAALCSLLLSDSRAEVRSAAAEALGEIASNQALPSLQQALNDAEPGVRAKVSWAIAEIQ